jgi:hypothetical protein
MGRFLEPPCLVMLYLAAKPSHVWVDVDGLACSLHRATVCSHQKVGQCRLTLCINFLSHGNGRPISVSSNAKPCPPPFMVVSSPSSSPCAQECHRGHRRPPRCRPLAKMLS